MRNVVVYLLRRATWTGLSLFKQVETQVCEEHKEKLDPEGSLNMDKPNHAGRKKI